MKKFVTSTLALAAAGSLGNAGPGDSEWSGLDSQLNTIRSSYTADGGLGSSYGAVVSVSLVSIDADVTGLHDSTAGATDDALAIDVGDALAFIEGEVNPEVNWRVSLDLDGSGSVAVFDAFIDITFGSGQLRAGRQIVPTARHLAFAPENRLFSYAPIAVTTSDLGVAQDEAVTYIGSGDSFAWSVGITNDSDGPDDELAIIGKATWMNADIDQYEGAYGNSDQGGIAVSVFYVDRGATDDGSTIGLDFVYDASNWSVSAGLLDNDDGVVAGGAGESPIYVQGSLAVGDNGVVGLRYSDADDATEFERITAVYQHYADGPNHTYSVELGQDDLGASDTDGTFIAFNVTAGNSGNWQDPITGLR